MLLRQGAEAEIHLTSWMGKQVIQKRRLVKTYRLKEIDEKLRKTRTKKEAQLMTDARRSGISVPIIYDVDINHCQIIMEYLDAPRVKDVLDDLTGEEQKSLCVTIGKEIAKLHRYGLIHGDITTSNLVLLKGRVYFIDFGLGEKCCEDEVRGVDLHLLMEAFSATHRNPRCFGWVIQGYRDIFGDASMIEKKIADISKRGRYMRSGTIT